MHKTMLASHLVFYWLKCACSGVGFGSKTLILSMLETNHRSDIRHMCRRRIPLLHLGSACVVWASRFELYPDIWVSEINKIPELSRKKPKGR